MGVLGTRFPDRIAANAEGGHGHFQTTIVRHQGGYETRNQDWQDAKGRWNVSKAVEITRLHTVARSYFYKARGSFHNFRFKDHHDFECDRVGNDKGRLTGAGTAWQINKVYGADEASFEYVRSLHRIVAGTLQIWRNSTLQTLTTHYTVDMDTGVVTSVGSWTGDTLEVACQFDVLCRFEFDEFSPVLMHRPNAPAAMFLWEDISIVEVRE